ncbi:MAG: hypothetical protein M3Z23_17705 [Acidobacteriota bacterium]|nr:hypothetical protein [Acidobacteriota bacterium]
MADTETINAHRVGALLAENGYDVSEPQPNVWRIREVESGVIAQAVLEGEILFLSLNCTVVPSKSLTPELMRKMLAGDNGISTSHFQLYDVGGGNVAIALSNFCKLQNMGPEDEDDILSCVHFLLADVVEARRLIS